MLLIVIYQQKLNWCLQGKATNIKGQIPNKKIQVPRFKIGFCILLNDKVILQF